MDIATVTARNLGALYLAVSEQTQHWVPPVAAFVTLQLGSSRVHPIMPQLNHRSKPPIKRHAPQKDDQRHRARPRGRGDDNADVVGRHSSQRHHAHIAQTNLREGVGTAANGYIQSWLKQTQSHRQHEPSSANESRHVPSWLHAREGQTNANKRARAPPDPVISPRRESRREPDYRFEKRPRHKVREDKYEHRGDGGKRRPGQKVTVQDRTSQQVSKGRAEQDSHGTNTRRPGQSSKGLAERAMKARNARMEQKEQEKNNEMDQFRAFFQHRTSSRRPPPQDKHSRQSLEELTYGNGSKAPWSRASSPNEGVFPGDRRISQRDTLGSPELFEQGRPKSVWEAAQNYAEPASPGPHYTAAKSTIYVTWSTSHHSEFFDDRFRGPPTDERENPRNESLRPQAQPSLQGRNSNGSNVQRPHGYKDAEVQTDPIALSPQRHRIPTRAPAEAQPCKLRCGKIMVERLQLPRVLSTGHNWYAVKSRPQNTTCRRNRTPKGSRRDSF
ncbi:hypothetical protein B0T18DRAFT_30426 [Schizothecium vesticola]|uniref:Uncharacterized protein n=1 Tax=Schizothecium vesticola TaxID=314040 RepID=A0AA40KCS5_9PEZI|nr:hypothetical protein B0T18DRAFT_30426 [Schizothecium vesticola]